MSMHNKISTVGRYPVWTNRVKLKNGSLVSSKNLYGTNIMYITLLNNTSQHYKQHLFYLSFWIYFNALWHCLHYGCKLTSFTMP